MKIGDKVRALTHPREAVTGSPPQQPGATGTVCGIGRVCGNDDPNLLRVRHDDGSEPWYYVCDLICIREGAFRINDRVTVRGLGIGKVTRAGDDGSYHIALDRGGTWSAASAAELVPVRERARIAGEEDPLEQRLATLERRHGALRGAMTSELHGLDQRLAALEPAEQLTGEPVANPAALAQAWERLTQVQRDELQRWMMTEKPGYLPPYAHRLAAESALVAVPGLVAEIVRLRAQRDKPPASVLQAYEGLHREVARWLAECPPSCPSWVQSALQTLAELGVTPGEPYPARDPDEPAPAPEAVETIEHLRQRVEELTEQRVRLLAAVAHVAGQARGIEDPDATSAELRRRICQALHVAPFDVTDEQIADLVTDSCQLYDRLADPEAYGIDDPERLADTALDVRQRLRQLRERHDAIVTRLRAIVPWDHPEKNSAEELLDAVEQPAKLVLLLIETTTPTQLVRVATGIRAIIGEGDHISPAALVAEMLEHLAEDGS